MIRPGGGALPRAQHTSKVGVVLGVDRALTMAAYGSLTLIAQLQASTDGGDSESASLPVTRQ
jgi:hypothetical protein